MGVKRPKVMYLLTALVLVLITLVVLSSFDAHSTHSLLFRETPLGDSEAPCPPPGTGKFSPVWLPITMLPSFPGSGNTWVRHLLTTATGLLTAAVYDTERDVHVNLGRSKRVLVVKTHLSPTVTRKELPFARALLIVRNPYEAYLAEFNRRGKFPEREGNPDYHKTHVRPIGDFRELWPKYLEHVNGWRKTNLAWANCSVPLHVLVFHRLTANLEGELHKVMSFLNESSIQQNIHCAARKPEGAAHRTKPDWLKNAAVYSPEVKAKLNADIDSVQKALEDKTGIDFSDFQRWKR